MRRNPKRRATMTVSFAVLLMITGWAISQPPRPNPPPGRPRPKLEAVAETKLLMEALLQANFRGLEMNLREKPVDEMAWVYARGQALLIAEAGNLLMLRPPKSQGQDAWLELCSDLRDKATRLARAAAAKDLDGSRKALADVAVSCNKCHATFGQATRITPFSDRP